jgi:hypothetical protein
MSVATKANSNMDVRMLIDDERVGEARRYRVNNMPPPPTPHPRKCGAPFTSSTQLFNWRGFDHEACPGLEKKGSD